MFFVKTPNFVRSYYKDCIWNVATQNKEIYLTFDDGPTPKVTDFVLTTLKQYQAQATFFCIGNNVKKNPNIIKQLIDEGHTIGNHTQDHLNGWKTNNKAYFESIRECDLSLNKYKEKTNNQISRTLFRPPYGSIKKSQIKHLVNEHKIIMWSVLSGDFDLKLSKEQCLNNVLKNTKQGDIIVFHDSVKAFDKLQYVLPKVLNHFTNEGYEFKTL